MHFAAPILPNSCTQARSINEQTAKKRMPFCRPNVFMCSVFSCQGSSLVIYDPLIIDEQLMMTGMLWGQFVGMHSHLMH